jgi:acyl-CoA thioester hydrolase
MSIVPPVTRADVELVATLPSRWTDNDHYGHINNATYFEYLDTAVNSWLMRIVGRDTREERAIGIVASVSCEFYADTSFPDVLEIGLAHERVGSSSVTYRIAVFRQGSPGLRALGRYVHVYVDRQNRRPTPIPAAVAAAVRALPRLTLPQA